MWSDNEASHDSLNFQMVADTVAEMIIQSSGGPLSLGVSGGWGVGKTTMIRLIEGALKKRGDDKFLFVQFNAWLYQGYDDARAALMDVIARALLERAKEKKTGTDKAMELLKRVDWIRAAKLAAGPALSMAFGLPPLGAMGDAIGAMGRLFRGSGAKEDGQAVVETGGKTAEAAASLIKPRQEESPPKEIQDLRQRFEDTLRELNVSLVVFIDDLDRCLPNTTIGTLEAIRLFLFLKNTAFVIAADETMVRHAVRMHFGDLGIDDSLVRNYFDKLIQVPIRVPPLGTQDVRAYMMVLFIEASGLPGPLKDELRQKICHQLALTWQGKRVDRSFVVSLIKDCPPELLSRLDTADRLAPLMTTASQIAGNPRLVKRFLNTLSIRISMARSQGLSVDEAVLAKLLLFERCARDVVYTELASAVNSDDEGKPRFLKPLEEQATAGQPIEPCPPAWNDPFVKEWLAMPPLLAGMDLRPAVYVSRDHMPIITPADQMSSEAAELLAALLEMRGSSRTLNDRLIKLSKRELGLIMERLLARARQVQEWGVPPILYACLAVAAIDPDQANRLAAFLSELSCQQLSAPLIPLIGNETWATSILTRWTGDKNTPGPVKKAIERLSGGAR